MKDIDLAYLAGFIDADGTISINKDRGGYSPRVSISNTHYGVLIKFKEMFGGTLSTKKVYKEHHTQSYTLVWRYDKALEIAALCSPYFVVKKKRAECLSRWKSVVKRNGRYTDEELESRDSLIAEIKGLNVNKEN